MQDGGEVGVLHLEVVAHLVDDDLADDVGVGVDDETGGEGALGDVEEDAAAGGEVRSELGPAFLVEFGGVHHRLVVVPAGEGGHVPAAVEVEREGDEGGLRDGGAGNVHDLELLGGAGLRVDAVATNGGDGRAAGDGGQGEGDQGGGTHDDSRCSRAERLGTE